MSHTVQIGQPVPDFKLPSSNGGETALHDLRGRKVVIYFYPKDNTPGCTQESCDFRDYHGDFEKYGATVIGISPDDLKSHAKFITKHSLPFELLADTEQKVSELFGVWQLKKLYGKEYFGVVRSTFLIDEQGQLAREWRSVKVAGHTDEVLTAVRELGQA
ncbi:thioredoxin-dependent thiol peroxidase [Paenibacillus sp. 481]|uniref:thioredoxin-dependent thiol peroxidase n=1 Tax=Paenibacillus sp. 481 TaxID=2835869 RepID=UPI001E2AF476|nr:thioredoxin-dependent thiol peroxidase [Paenibacillus sp. 481]UHA71814.1 thioredoxin-dependent thiol peroxidase [Paenibacillus sp. 481]